MESISTAMSTAFQAVQTNVTSMITTSAPYALGIIGTVLAVTISSCSFKSCNTKRARARTLTLFR